MKNHKFKDYLGKLTDREIAKITGAKISAIVVYRIRHNLPPVKKIAKKQTDRNRKYLYKKKYGITIDEYENIFVRQGGKCFICKQESPKLLSVDHDHESGKIRGLLCGSCNLMLGYAKDNTVTLENAISYLKGNEKI